MNIIYLILCVVILQVQAKKLLVCLPGKHKFNDVKQAELSYKNSFLGETNDEIHIKGNFSSPVVIEDVISANVSASNIIISGFNNITETLLPLVITLNALEIRGNYQIQGTISDLFDIYGDGKFEMNLEASMAITDIQWKFLSKCIYMNLKMKLPKMKVNFDNIMGGDDLLQPVMNLIIGDMVPEMTDEYWPIIYDILQPTIQDFIDKYINHPGVKNFSTLHLDNETVVQNEYIRTSLKFLSDLVYTHLGNS